MLEDSTVIMMFAYDSVNIALGAMKVGAYDFISKPFKTDDVLLTLKKGEVREPLKKENINIKIELQRCSHQSGFDSIICDNKELEYVVQLTKKVAPYDTTVFINGEPGTGREHAARGIHANFPRKTKLFFVINCASHLFQYSAYLTLVSEIGISSWVSRKIEFKI